MPHDADVLHVERSGECAAYFRSMVGLPSHGILRGARIFALVHAFESVDDRLDVVYSLREELTHHLSDLLGAVRQRA